MDVHPPKYGTIGFDPSPDRSDHPRIATDHRLASDTSHLGLDFDPRAISGGKKTGEFMESHHNTECNPLYKLLFYAS